MEAIRKNQQIWNKLYQEGKSNLTFPNENLVRCMYYLLGGKDVSGVTALDYGFGSGNNLAFLHNFGLSVYGYEISEHAKAMTLKKMPEDFPQERLTVKGGESSLPYGDDFFDMVIAWQVLNYNTYESLIATLNELKRISKPGAKFVCTLGRPNDIASINSNPVGKFERVISSGIQTQQDATIVVIPTEEQLREAFFMFSKIDIGYFESKFNGIVNSHWVINGEA